MFPDESSRRRHDRLARLLAGPGGGEILGELLNVHALPRPAESDGARRIGVWELRDQALHRRSDVGCDSADWADVDHVPPAGDARRVVLLGESAARGWPYDPGFNCAGVLARHLDQHGEHPYQVVDLARRRASAADLIEVAERLPALEPDIVVVFAGNNVAVPPEEIEMRAAVLDDLPVQAALADALHSRGYSGLRDVLAEVTLARCRRLLDRLAPISASGARIVVVVPEFNLAGWTPEPDVETPLLAGAALAAWYELADEARAAGAAGCWAQVAPLAAKMSQLDEGTSPLPGFLAGTAARHLGDAAAARSHLEHSRDAACGLLVSCAPRVTAPLQDLMRNHARDRGWPCVDLRDLFADPQMPALPAQRWFHDYCHLSDVGIELAMAAVADAVLGLPSGTTAPGPGVPPTARGFAHAHAAIHLAYVGQPAAPVVRHLRAAVEIDPDLVSPLTAVRDLLSGPNPRWVNPAVRTLLAMPSVRPFLISLVQTDGLPAGMWTLRRCLGEVLGAERTGDGDGVSDMLLGPHCGGHELANFTPARCHHQATVQCSRLHFAADPPWAGRIELTYRTPWALTSGAEVAVAVNGHPLATMPPTTTWRNHTVHVPAHAVRHGVNELRVRWPIPHEDLDDRHALDAAALRRGQFPYVLPLFGELFTARVGPEV